MITRFITAQKKDFKTAYKEIKRGKKETHWIWYIFPQLKELGVSDMAKYYGIQDIQEAQEYYNNKYLRNNLNKICKALLKHTDKDIFDIVWYDDVKVHSCITLFLQVDKDNKLFKQIIDKFYYGELDYNTLDILER